MRKTFFALTAVALLAGACSRKSGGGVKLKADTDSVAYIIGMNVGMNLLKMDSTLNVNAVCEGIRDVFRAGAKLSADDAELYYLRYMNYVLPEKARAYEEQFLADFAKSNRSYARTPSGVTYTVEVLQKYLDQACGEKSGWSLDYVHGDADAAGLAQSGATAALLGAMDKRALFPAIAAGGVLPRKTFSMGEATEKRYYMECRRIDAKNP